MTAHLSPDVKLFLQANAPDRARFLAALDRPAGPAEQKHIEASGCCVRSLVGDVVTLECDRTSLQRLIAWPRLVSVELSGPLFPESP